MGSSGAFRLRLKTPCGKDHGVLRPRSARHFAGPCPRCRSSVVEHSLGKGEVVSSILPGSTNFPQINQTLAGRPLPCPPALGHERVGNCPTKLGENWGTLFTSRSGPPRPPDPEKRSPAGPGG